MKNVIFVLLILCIIFAYAAARNYGSNYMAKVSIRGDLTTGFNNPAAWVNILEGEIPARSAKVSKDKSRANLPTRSSFERGGIYYVYYQATGDFGRETHFALEKEPLKRTNSTFNTFLVLSLMFGIAIIVYIIWCIRNLFTRS